jgi:hypothetical protein
MVSDEKWIELWMRENDQNKLRLQNEGSLAVCLDLEARVHAAGLDTRNSWPRLRLLEGIYTNGARHMQ